MSNHVKIYGVKPRKQYVADGTSTTFDFPFAIFNSSDLDVYLGTVLQESTAYTVSGTDYSDGGTVTFTSAPSNGTLVTIVRNLSIERTSDFQEASILRAKTLNDELDYQTACLQQIAENLNRSMVLPAYAADNDLDLTLPMPAAGKAIVWNSTGTNLENSTVEVNALESTIKGYKTSAETAASTATTKAGIATDAASTATTQAGIATTKATEAANTVASKANKDMDNLSATGKEKVANLAMPSDSYVDLTVEASGTSYTAPADGYYFAGATFSSPAGCLQFFLSKYAVSWTPGNTGYPNGYICLPVKKGSSVEFSYQGGTVTDFRFIYAQGEV